MSTNIRNLLHIKFKKRHDSLTDQYNRIFMMKMALISSMILGLDWFKGTIWCIVPYLSGLDEGYVDQACWIQGMKFFFFIFIYLFFFTNWLFQVSRSKILILLTET